MIKVVNKKELIVFSHTNTKYLKMYQEILEALPTLKEGQVIEYRCPSLTKAKGMTNTINYWFYGKFGDKYIQIKQRGAVLFIEPGPNYDPDKWGNF